MTTAPDAPAESRSRKRGQTPRRLQARRAAGFSVALFLVLILAFNGGGYDVDVRHHVGLAVWAAIAVGVGFGILPRAQLSQAGWTAMGALIALALLALLSHAWTNSDERTTEEFARIVEYTGIVALAYLSLNRYTWRGAATGLVTGLMVVPFFAVAARLFPDLITDHFAQQIGTDRLSYPFDYWNAVACWGAMAVAAGLALSANASRREVRAASLACVPVALLTVYLSYSRFGVAAVAVAVLAAVALSRNRWTAVANTVAAGAIGAIPILVAHSNGEIARATGTEGAGSVALALFAAALGCAAVAALTERARLDTARMDIRSSRIALGAAGVCALLVAVALHGPIGDAWSKFKNDSPPPAAGGTERFSSLGSTRYEVWSTAVDAFKAHPVGGVGPGGFEYYWSQHGELEFVRDAHSLYLEEAAELGLPGLLVLLTVLGALLVAAIQARMRWRRRREIGVGSALIAAYVVFLAYAGIDWMWELAAVGTAGLGAAAIAGAGGFDRVERDRIQPWMRVTLVVLALAAAVTQVPGLVATDRIRASETELAAGDQDRAVELADQAVDAEPWAGSPYAARALALEAQGELGAAKAAAEDAIDRDPNNWRNYLILARIDAARGDRRGVDAQLREVKRLAPNSLYLSPLSPFRQSLDQLLGQSASRQG